MNNPNHATWSAFALAVSLLASACDVDVRGNRPSRDADVDVQTPVGRLSVRTDERTPETGLAIYPGAQPLRADGEGNRATVAINTWFVDVEVAAAEFESPDAPAAVLAFYHTDLARYGEVLECRGDIDFKGRKARKRAVCDEHAADDRATQLVVGTEQRHRMVTVKPRGGGSEFSLVSIRTREGS